MAGEVSWRVPSLSLADEAIELFGDRARHARPGFTLTQSNAAAVGEICRRLDGVPLAIELAAARVRALSLSEILDSLDDRFRLLTGGARTAVRRQQTLRAFGGLVARVADRTGTASCFAGWGCFWAGWTSTPLKPSAAAGDAAALPGPRSAHPAGGQVAGGRRGRRGTGPATGCWRRCANTRWKSSANPARPTPCRTRHRDYYAALGGHCSTPRRGDDYGQCIERVEAEIDNLRAAFAWSRENSDVELSAGAGVVAAAAVVHRKDAFGKG